MCPQTAFFQFIVGILLLILLFQTARIYKSARANFGVFSKLLSSPQFNWLLVFIRLEGFYRGRKVVLTYWLLSGEGTNPVELYIEPRCNLKRQKFICLRYPHPTENTMLRDKKLYYVDCNFRKRAYKEIYTDQKFLDILEKLTKGVEAVEKDPKLNIGMVRLSDIR